MNVRAVAHQQQAGLRLLRTDVAEDLDDRIHPFDRAEVRHVDDQVFRALEQLFTEVARRAPCVPCTIEEVGNDLDVSRHSECPVCIGLQAFRDRRDRIRLFDAVRDGFRIRRVAADDRDVSAVKRRDDGGSRASTVRDDLACKVRGGRVRNRVVRVDDIERLRARNLHDLVRQREQVLRFPEERVRRRLDAMKGQPRLIAQPERRLTADDVHLMAALGKRRRELSGDDAAASD